MSTACASRWACPSCVILPEVGALVVVVIIAVIVAAAWWSYAQRQKRREELLAFATQYRLELSREDRFGLTSYPFPLFRQGEGRGCENVLAGTWQGLPVKEADYWYYTESTDSNGRKTRTYHRFSIVLADLTCAVPNVSIHRESLLTKMADHLGFHDIDFESEDFNRRYQVKAADREFAFKLVDDRMMRWLLSTDGSSSFEVNGSDLLVWCRRLKPTELVPLFGTAKAFVDHVPNLVWNDYGTGERAASASPDGGGN